MKKIEKSQVEFEFTIDANEVEKHLDKAAKEISKDVDIKGFRKGKAPKEVLEKMIGKGAIFERAAEFAIQEKYIDFIKKEKLAVIDHPKIDVKKMAEGNPVVVGVKVAVYPEVKLGDYKKIKEKEAKNRKKDIKATEDEIKSNLEYLQSSRAKEKEVQREAKKDDLVEVDFQVRLDGVKIEGGDSKNHPVKIGAGKFMPGFEDELIGLKMGEEKDFKLKAPKDYFKKDLAGKELNFHVKINRVLEVELPKIDDDFAKSFGDFKTLDDLKKNIAEGTEKQKAEKEKQEYIDALIKKIVESSEIDLPEIMLEREKEKMIAEMENNVMQHGLDFNTYLTSIKKTREDLKKDFTTQAEARVKSVLVIEKIAEEEKIEATEDEIKNKLNEALLRYSEEDKKKIDMEQLKLYATSVVKNEKVLEFLEK